MKASVAICTYNRADDLARSIESVFKQEGINLEEIEIIVVDNKSTDHTKQVVTEAMIKPKVEVNYFYEENQGLSYARNRAIRESRGTYIMFLDDDAFAEPSWLKNMISVFEMNEEIGCVGGKIEPYWEGGEPKWIPEEYKSLYSVLNFSDHIVEMQRPYIPFGANVAFRRMIFDVIDPFREDLGRVGNNLLSSEESELIGRIREKFVVMYTPFGAVEHKISKDRISKKWLYRRSYWQGMSDIVKNRESAFKQGIRAILGMGHAIVYLLFSLNNHKRKTRQIVRISYRSGLFMGIYQYKLKSSSKL
ncbi:glycosyltransferase [Neobacillus mesonae]|nr:glycosyltransferase [Neobacillus mesonae]